MVYIILAATVGFIIKRVFFKKKKHSKSSCGEVNCNCH
ncbi:hypothetical protein ACE01N_01920 [Saccharicrinis sp. FJH2]